ncbi:MAG: hypothetical protein RL387_1604 [Bacteroidota bacterium]|jgi:hypothetical protein
MEVHHHSHHPKKWKEYISEFLMLFFAVFLGFMSEYYLEYRAERHKEHDYLVSMVEDLKADTTEIGIKNLEMTQVLLSGDKLNQLAYKNNWSEEDIDTIYLKSIYITSRIVVINFTTGTIDQLKNAGGFRLIRNQEIVRKITQYEQSKNTIKLQGEAMDDKWNQVHINQNGLIHFKVFSNAGKLGSVQYDKKMLNEIDTLTGSKFLKKDKLYFYEYANYIGVMCGYTSYYQIMANIQKQKATELIAIIEKELSH